MKNNNSKHDNSKLSGAEFIRQNILKPMKDLNLPIELQITILEKFRGAKTENLLALAEALEQCKYLTDPINQSTIEALTQKIVNLELPDSPEVLKAAEEEIADITEEAKNKIQTLNQALLQDAQTQAQNQAADKINYLKSQLIIFF